MKNALRVFSNETKLSYESFANWKEVLNKLKIKIYHFQSKTIQYQTKPTLYDLEVKIYLVFIHKSFVIITIDKAPNNYVVLICKMFYKNHLSDEVGIIGNWNTKTSSKVSTSKNEIANTKRQTKKSTNYVLASKKFQGY